MSVRIVSALARPDLADQADEATADAFPEYNTHGDVASPRWSRLYEEYPAFQLVLWDDATGDVLGEANTMPCRFDGTVQRLPRGIDEVLATGPSRRWASRRSRPRCPPWRSPSLRAGEPGAEPAVAGGDADAGR